MSRRYTLDALSFLRKCSLARTGSYSGGCSSSTQVGSACGRAWRRGSGGRGPGDGSEDQRLRLRCVGRHKSSAPR